MQNRFIELLDTMNARKVLSVFLLVFLAMKSVPATADQLSKSAKLRELATELGYVESISNGLPSNTQLAEQAKKQVLESVMPQLEAIDSEFAETYEFEFRKFMDAINPPGMYEKLFTKFMDLYGARMTEQEIDQILAFLRSPTGRKSSAVEKEVATVVFMKSLAEDQIRFEAELKVFAARVQQLVAERRAKKRQTQSAN